MPYLPTPNAFLEQSSLLLEAYPDNTRITTKYSYPSSTSLARSTNKNNIRISKSKPAIAATPDRNTAAATATATLATLTVKTYNPVTGICLKYKTNKAAEVGRLISGLGKLAAGVKIGAEDVAAPGAPGAPVAQDVEMIDVSQQQQQQQQPVQSQSQAAGGGGGKKKKGKGKK